MYRVETEAFYKVSTAMKAGKKNEVSFNKDMVDFLSFESRTTGDLCLVRR